LNKWDNVKRLMLEANKQMALATDYLTEAEEEAKSASQGLSLSLELCQMANEQIIKESFN